MGRPRPGLSTMSVNEAVVSGKHCIDWYPAQRRSSDGEIRKQIPTSSGTNPERPSPHDIRMSQWPWARLERRAVCAERCPYGSGRRSAHALLTPFPMARGFVYLAAVVDWAELTRGSAECSSVEWSAEASRRVLAHRVSITMEADFCIEVLEEALAKHGKQEIFNTDQGSPFTGADFTAVPMKNAIAISMDGKGSNSWPDLARRGGPRQTGSTARLWFVRCWLTNAANRASAPWPGRRRLKTKTLAGFAVSARR